MAIRWKEGELDDLRREIARYNRKILKLQKAGTDLGMGSLPERGRIRDVKKMTSRTELNAFRKQMARVLKPGSEELVKTKGGVVIPKYERAEINALNARINARRRKSYAAAQEARSSGDLPLMGRIRANEAKPRRALKDVTPAGYAEYKRVARNEGAVDYVNRRQKQYRQSYYKMIDNLFTEKDARKIKRRLSRIPDEELVRKTIKEEEISFSIGSPPATGKDTVSDRMIESFKKVFPDEFRTFKREEETETTAEDVVWGGAEAPDWFDD